MTSSLWQYAFVHNALLAGAIVAIISGLVGPFVVMRNLSFAVHAVGEVGFTGAAAALLVGAAPALGMLSFTLVAALAIGLLGVRVRERDVAIGATLAFALGLGVLFLSLYTRYANEAFALLFGSILGISRQQVLFSGGVALIAALALIAMYRPLRFASVDPDVAAARGVPLGLLSAAFLVVLAFTVAEAVQVVGVLLLLTLIISPAAAAERLTAHPGWASALSVLIALGCTLGGIVLAVYKPWPVSFFVSALSFGVYLAARLAGSRRRRPTGGLG